MVTWSGSLASGARRSIRIDGAIPMPRAGIAAVAVPPLLVLERLGLLDDATAQVDAAVAQLEQRRVELGADLSPVTRVARRIGRTLPIVYGGGALGEVAAWRWKGQFNENPKVASFANRVPGAHPQRDLRLGTAR